MLNAFRFIRELTLLPGIGIVFCCKIRSVDHICVQSYLREVLNYQVPDDIAFLIVKLEPVLHALWYETIIDIKII